MIWLRHGLGDLWHCPYRALPTLYVVPVNATTINNETMSVIKNYTPHPIHLLDESGNVIRTFAPEGLVRLSAKTVELTKQIDGCRITVTEFGEAEGLPSQELGTYYIVSQMVKSALSMDRIDLLVPAEVVRDPNGDIIGCRSFGL